MCLLLIVGSMAMARLGAAPIGEACERSQGERFVLNIPSARIDLALFALARETGKSLMMPSEFETQQRGNALNGSYTLCEALSALLEGTSLSASLTESGVIAISLDRGKRQQNEGSTMLRTGSSISLLAGAATFLFGGVVLAEDSSTNVEEIVVRGTKQTRYNANKTEIGRMSQDVILFPRAVTVIPEQVLLDQQVYDISDALKNVGGLTDGDGFGGTITDYFIRGFRRNEFHQNGMKISTGGANQPPTQNIESIEVIKGPASVLYGQLEPGGMVNIRTKKPSFEHRGFAQTVFDDYGKRLATVDVTGPVGGGEKVAVRFNASLEKSDTFRDMFEIKREFVSPSVLWKLTPDTTAIVSYEYFHDNRPMDRGMVALRDAEGKFYIPDDIPIGRRYGEAFDERNSRVSMGEASLEHRFSDTWTGTAAFLLSQENAFDVYTDNSSITPAGILTRSVGGSNDREVNVLIGSAWMNGAFSTRSIEHKVSLGMDYRDYSTSYLNGGGPDVGGFDIFNPVRGLITDNRPSRGDPISNEEQAFGAFLQDQVSLTQRFLLLGGARYDQTEGEASSISGTTRINKKVKVTPQIGALFQPTRNTSLYASYSRGFVPVTNVDSFTGKTFDPQESVQYEIGAKARVLDERLQLSTALYDLKKTNIVAADPNGRLDLIGEVRSRGFEADIIGQIRPGMNVIGSYAYCDNEILTETSPDRGHRTNNVAKHTFRLWSSYEARTGRFAGLGAGVGVNYTSDRFANTANTVDIGGYTLVDVGAWYYVDATSLGWEAGKQIRLGLNVKNLFDERYYAGAGSALRINPGRPRTIIASFGLTF